MSYATTRSVARKVTGWVLLFAGCITLSGLEAASGVRERDIVGFGQQGAQQMTIRIAIGATTITAKLDDNPTARDFAAMLPLTLILRDFGSAEKVSGALPRRLSERGAPATAAGAVGDIAYYAPWRNIAFYRGAGPEAAGVIRIARITTGIEALDQQGQLQAVVSLAD